MEKINGICVDGKFYKISEGNCLKCAFCDGSDSPCGLNEVCLSMPYPNPEKDNCVRFSQELTDKLNGRSYTAQEPTDGFITKRNRK